MADESGGRGYQNRPISDPSEEIHWPMMSKWLLNPKKGRRTGIGEYAKMLTDEIKSGAPGVENYYRNILFSGLGNQVEQQNMAARQGVAQGFGMNNPTGLLPAFMAQNQREADYGGANLTAARMRQQRMRELGNELMGVRQKGANWYATAIAPWLQWSIAEEQRKTQEAMAAAQLAASAG